MTMACSCLCVCVLVQLSQAESELVDVTMDFQRLGKYFTEYKDKSAEKVCSFSSAVMCGRAHCLFVDGHSEGQREEG